MMRMLLQSTAVALGLVTVVLGVMVIIGKTDFLPYLIGAAVLFVGDLLLLLLQNQKGNKALEK